MFQISEASGVRQGTKIVLHLKDECKEFSSEDRVKGNHYKYIIGGYLHIVFTAAVYLGHCIHLFFLLNSDCKQVQQLCQFSCLLKWQTTKHTAGILI